MANYQELKNAIADVIKTNGNQEITGRIMQNVLDTIVNNLVGYQYLGIAEPTTMPGTPDQNVYYIAYKPGRYSGFSNIDVASGEIVTLKWAGTWIKEDMGAVNIDGNVMINVSNLYPKNGYTSSGVIGGDRYTLLLALQQIPNELRIPGTIIVYRSYSNYPYFEMAQHIGLGSNWEVDGTWRILPAMIVDELGDKRNASISQYVVSSSLLLSMGLKVLDDELKEVSKIIKNFKLYDNYIFEDNTQYYIKYLQNTTDRFLIQILDNNNNVIAQHYDENKGRDGIITVELDHRGILFGTITVDTAYMTPNTKKFNIEVLNTACKQFNIINETFIIPAGNLDFTWITSTKEVSVTFPKSTRVYYGNKVYMMPQEQSLKVILREPYSYIVFNNKTKMLEIVPYNKITSNMYIVGGFNWFSQGSTMWLNSMKYTLNGNPGDLSYKSILDLVKPYRNRKIVCFGDSVTEFGDYPEQMATIIGATTYKVGFGGCRMGSRDISTEAGNAYNELSMYKLSEAIKNSDFAAATAAVEYLKNNESDDNTVALNVLKSIDFSAIDFVTIFYGSNDWTSGYNTIGAENSADPKDIRGAVNIIVNNLMTKYPNLKILFITPTHRFFGGAGSAYDSDTTPNALGVYLSEFCNAIEESANYNHLPCLNMYREGGLNKYNHKLLFEDGAHPNNPGHTYLARKFSAYLQSLFKYY